MQILFKHGLILHGIASLGQITWTEIGVGRYFRGHNSNLKFAFTRIERDGSPDRDQLRLQWQVFAF